MMTVGISRNIVLAVVAMLLTVIRLCSDSVDLPRRICKSHTLTHKLHKIAKAFNDTYLFS